MSDSQDNENWVICVFLEPFIYLSLPPKFLLNESVNEYIAERCPAFSWWAPFHERSSTELQLRSTCFCSPGKMLDQEVLQYFWLAAGVKSRQDIQLIVRSKFCQERGCLFLSNFIRNKSLYEIGVHLLEKDLMNSGLHFLSLPVTHTMYLMLSQTVGY